MGTHPIFESDFDCLTDSSMSKQLSKEEIVQHYQGLCQESRQMQQKRAELNQERGEHELVTKTLRKADSDRKCWRLIGGVLTERTVGQVLPAVETQVENISSSIKSSSRARPNPVRQGDRAVANRASLSDRRKT